VVALPGFGTPEVGPSAATGGPFSFGQTDWPEFALLRFTNRAGLGRVGGFSIAYVVGATHFPWVGAAIETQLATIPALIGCLPQTRHSPAREVIVGETQPVAGLKKAPRVNCGARQGSMEIRISPVSLIRH
jgi:hypothetical protein